MEHVITRDFCEGQCVDLLADTLIEMARELGVQRLSLETGSTHHFAPARELYAAHGFSESEPFADYSLDPHSTFMTRAL